MKGIELLAQDPRGTVNHSYFPVFGTDCYPVTRDQLDERLRTNGIFARPHFCPSIPDFPMYRGLASASPENLPVATRVARQVLCLPIYPELPLDDVGRVCRIIRQPA